MTAWWNRTAPEPERPPPVKREAPRPKPPPLTDEQRVEAIVARWRKIEICTDQPSDAEITRRVDEFYKACEMKPPIHVEVVASVGDLTLTDEDAAQHRAIGRRHILSEARYALDQDRYYSRQGAMVIRQESPSKADALILEQLPTRRNFVPTVSFYTTNPEGAAITVRLEATRHEMIRFGAAITAGKNAALTPMLSAGCAYLLTPARAVIVRNPTSIVTNDAGQVNCETGPAVTFADGSELFIMRDMTIPAGWLSGELPTVADALAIENADMRSLALELIGWDKAIDEVTTRVIDKHDDPLMGSLLLVDLPNTGPELFLKAQCGTGRTVALCVTDSRARTVQQAQNWVWSLEGTGINYQPEHRT